MLSFRHKFGRLSAAVIVCAVMLVALQVVMAAGFTVTPSNLQGWQIIPDGTVPYSFDIGPGAPPAGIGSLRFGPIDGANPANKFIMRAPILMQPTASFTSLSYSLYVDPASPVGVNHLYVNVYVDSAANGLGTFPLPRWYDCRYDYVPSGATGAWLTAGFDSSFTAWAGITNYIGSCPTSLGALPAGSAIMFIVFNGGQSNASDAGLSGAFDNIVFTTSSGVDTWDFEPDTIIDPATGKPVVVISFADGRINNFDQGAPVAAYPHDAGQEARGFIVYEIFENSSGVFALVVSPDEIAAVPAKPEQNTLIAEGATERLRMTFWRLSSGEFQLNVIRPGGKTYVLTFPHLIPGGGGYTSFEYD